MPNIVKQDIKLSPSSQRKLFFVLNKKERNSVFDECIYFSKIYAGISTEQLMECLTNKHFKQKIFKICYPDITRDVNIFKEHIEQECKFILKK